MSQTLDSLVVELRADIKGLQASLQTAAGDVQRFSNKASASVDGFQTSIGRARVAILSLGTAWAAFRVGKGIIDAGMQMQALQNRFIAATGDAKVAADGLAFVRAESERLGLAFKEAAGSFAAFSASALRSGMTLQQTKDIFSSVAEAATALHLSPEQASSAFLALEQMASKGTVQMQELKLQLSQAIPGAFEIMAKAMNVSVSKLNDMMAKGNLLSSEALPKLGEELHRQFGGVAVQAADSAQSAVNRLGNAFFDLQTQIANSGVLEVFTTAVRDLTTALNDPDMVNGLKGFAELMGEAAHAALLVASAVGKANNAIDDAATKGASFFGKRFADEVALVKRQAESGLGVDSQKLIDSITAKGGLKFKMPSMGNTGGLSSEGAFAGGEGTVSGDYSLGKVTPPEESEAQKKAREKAARLREQMRNQVSTMSEGFVTEGDPNKIDSARAVAALNKKYAEEQLLLDKALKNKAISDQEFKDNSLKSELDYQARLSDIRKQYRDDFLSDEQAFAEGFLGIQIGRQNQSLEQQGQSFRESISEAAKHNQAFFLLEKAAALARATLAAYESVVSSYNFGARIGGPPLGAVFAGVAAAAQAVNIAAIASTSFGGGTGAVSSGGSSGGGSSTSASSDTASAPASAAPTKNVYITLNGRGYSKNDIRDLIDGLNDAFADGSQLKIVGVNV